MPEPDGRVAPAPAVDGLRPALAADAWLFLPAWGLDALGLNYCPAPPDHAALMREVAAGDRPSDERVTERGGRNSKLQFRLLSDTVDDLDLDVTCPESVIDGYPGHTGPGICGDGRKDLAANRNTVENRSEHPIENVVWQTDIP